MACVTGLHTVSEMFTCCIYNFVYLYLILYFSVYKMIPESFFLKITIIFYILMLCMKFYTYKR